MGEVVLWFAVPLFPISILTFLAYHWAEGKLKDFFIPLLVLLAFFGLGLGGVDAGGFQKFLALLGSAMFTYLLYETDNPFTWLFYYYGAFTALSWFQPEKMLLYLIVGAFPIVAFNFVLIHLKESTSIVSFDDIAGLGGFTSVVSFVSSVSVIMFLLVAPAYNFFVLYRVFVDTHFWASVFFVLFWIAWLFSGVPKFIKMFSGLPKFKRYEPIEGVEAFVITILLLISVLFVVLY